MILKKTVLSLLIFLAGVSSIYAQGRSMSKEELIKTGISFYNEGKFTEASTILQLALPASEALYWLSLSELSLGNYSKSLFYLETLEKADPGGKWSSEISYHRGRCFFYLGRHEEAIKELENYAEKLGDENSGKGSPYYWIGESLFAMGRLDEAADIFSMIIEKYPYSVKYEAASYRLNLIVQKKIELELLTVLKWSHEESLKSIEEYQERERDYQLAIIAYQKQLNELHAASGAVETNSALTADNYHGLINSANQRITDLESRLAEANADLIEISGTGMPGTQALSDSEKTIRILELKASILELSNALNKKLNESKQ